MSDLAGKVLLVTGATSGLGATAAISLAAQGAAVVITGRRKNRGEAVLAEIKSNGGQGIFVQSDVNQRAHVEAMIAKTIKHFGRLDGAVNNAGISGDAFIPTAEISEQNWMATINTNLNSVFMSMKFEIPAMLANGGGSIVNVSSIYGLHGSDVGHAAYAASKHGVIGLTKSAAIDYGQKGIRINALCPGYCHSEMVDPIADEMPELASDIVVRHSASNRMGKAQEVANAIEWLLSSKSSFVNGTSIRIDGGETTPIY